MRTFTTEHTVYTFDELSDAAKDKALDNLRYINVEHDWWESTYEDAYQIGLTIDGFDIDHHEIDGRLDDDLPTVCQSIVDEHGPGTETHQLAVDYLKQWETLVAKYSDGINLDQVADDADKQDDFDAEADELTKQFEYQLLQEYLSMLAQECEYLMSDEVITELIKANEYEFTKDGELA